ncbi:MAG: hypothetical protein ACPLW9_02550 [Minisyncoccales bacterium]
MKKTIFRISVLLILLVISPFGIAKAADCLFDASGNGLCDEPDLAILINLMAYTPISVENCGCDPWSGQACRDTSTSTEECPPAHPECLWNEPAFCQLVDSDNDGTIEPEEAQSALNILQRQLAGEPISEPISEPTSEPTSQVPPPPPGGGGIVACVSNWQCSAWSACVNDLQTRTCLDLANCPTPTNKPAESVACVAPAILAAQVCTPGEMNCLSNNLVKCNSAGTDWLLVQACANGCENDQCLSAPTSTAPEEELTPEQPVQPSPTKEEPIEKSLFGAGLIFGIKTTTFVVIVLIALTGLLGLSFYALRKRSLRKIR